MCSVFDYYVEYLKVKCHFNCDKFDYFKYPKPKCDVESFNRRRDNKLFYAVKNKYTIDNWHDILIANFRLGYNVWVGDCLSTESLKNYKEYIKNKESLTYLFEDDLNSLSMRFNLIELFKTNNPYPIIIQLILKNKIRIETFAILNECLDFYSHMNYDDIYFNELKRRTIKYGVFLKIDKIRYIKIIKRMFTKLN